MEFGCNPGEVDEALRGRVEQVCRRHGVRFLTGGGHYWFEARGNGSPFDEVLIRTLATDLVIAGVELP